VQSGAWFSSPPSPFTLQAVNIIVFPSFIIRIKLGFLYLTPSIIHYPLPAPRSTMYLPALPNTLLLLLALYSQQAHSDDNPKPVDPCTVASSSGSFYDLRPLAIRPLADGKKPGKNEKTDSWHARGYDYMSNFTLNICAPVVEDLHDVEGIDRSLYKNISAFYEDGSKTYSLG
jgi:hypothetical protein